MLWLIDLLNIYYYYYFHFGSVLWNFREKVLFWNYIINFVNLFWLFSKVRNLGKPVELAGQYYKDGADEVYLFPIQFWIIGILVWLTEKRHAWILDKWMVFFFKQQNVIAGYFFEHNRLSWLSFGGFTNAEGLWFDYKIVIHHPILKSH